MYLVRSWSHRNASSRKSLSESILVLVSCTILHTKLPYVCCFTVLRFFSFSIATIASTLTLAKFATSFVTFGILQKYSCVRITPNQAISFLPETTRCLEVSDSVVNKSWFLEEIFRSNPISEYFLFASNQSPHRSVLSYGALSFLTLWWTSLGSWR